LYAPLFNCFYLCVCCLLACTFVQLFLSVRVFSSCMYLCSIVFICACLLLVCTFIQLFLSVQTYREKQLNKGTNKRKTNAQIKTIEQMYKQEDNTRTDKNNWTKVQTRGKHPLVCTFVQLFLSVRLFPLICTFVQLFLSVRVFSSCLYLCSVVFICACVFLLYVPLLYKRKTHAQMKTTEQRYKQEEDKRTDKNNWTKVHTRGKHTHR
jgi:Ca2+/H+ antiporter